MARGILADWDAAKSRFWKVFPHEYAAAIKQQVWPFDFVVMLLAFIKSLCT